MITLVGIGHIFDLEKKLEEIISREKPNLVCIELDEERFRSLLLDTRKGDADVPFAYNLLARFQRKIAKLYGVKAGSEMLAAANIAKERGIRIEFIDVNIREVFNKMWKKIPFKEKFRLFLSFIVSIFVGKSQVERELKRYQDNETLFLEEISKSLPTVKRIIVDERDQFMAERLKDLSKDHERIVAIVGDGHVRGIERYLREEGLEVKVIRLRELIDLEFKDP